jgi:hypothetical protein
MTHILWRKSGNDWRMSKTKPPDLAEVPMPPPTAEQIRPVQQRQQTHTKDDEKKD